MEGEFDIEEGVFKNGLLNGKGCSIHLGAKQQGEFKNGLLNGRGKIIYSDGYVEEGEFRDNILIPLHYDT